MKRIDIEIGKKFTRSQDVDEKGEIVRRGKYVSLILPSKCNYFYAGKVRMRGMQHRPS